MLSNEIENRLSGLIAWGSLGVTLVVTDRIGTEPVNLGKMLLLVIIAGGSLALTSNTIRRTWRTSRALFLTLALFLLVSLTSIIVSNNPWEHGFYGTFGRNTGFLTYLALSGVFISTSVIRQIASLYKIILALLIAGLLNLIYCVFASFGIEIFKWNNPYKTILGTFGNPDFISAFLGIFIAALFGLLASSFASRKNIILLGVIILTTFYVIKETHALQGYIVAATGIALVGFSYLRSFVKRKWILFTYLIILMVGAIISVLGTLQKGPLGALLYKPSVTFRGEYWRTGMNMGTHNLLTGVGMDSYGTYYRVFRSPSAIVTPGVNVTTDAAHNVFIDIFAGIGVVGFICYLTLIFLVFKASYKLFREHQGYDPIFTILFTSWFAYQLQSFISINQIGLAVWGWVLGGALIAYSRITNRSVQLEKILNQVTAKNKKKNPKSTPVPLSAGQSLSLFLGLVLGFLIAFPPFLADARTRSAFASQKAEAIIAVANEWPQDPARMNRVVMALANSGLNAQAQSMVNSVTSKFPKDYPGWYSLFKISLDGSPAKARYSKKLHELDPYNPEFAPK